MPRPTATTDADGTWVPEDDAAPRPPALLPPRYVDRGPIGRGGGGEVRRVFDTQLGRALAMKILPVQAPPGSAAHRRFVAEARVTARLEHPGVVPVHDQGVLADGRPFYTMREVRGETLAARLRDLHGDGPGAWRTAGEGALRRTVAVLHRIAEAVAYAHAEGVVHRDLKPDNVLLGPFGEVHVVDFGLVRAIADAAGAPVPGRGATRHGTVMGTPAYMAPEQARGETDAQGPQTDVFALGAILYEILGGRPPYPGTAEQAWARAREGVTAPLGRAPDGGPLPEPLVSLQAACRALDPTARPTADGVGEALQGWLDGSRARERALASVAAARPAMDRAAALQREAEGRHQQAAASRLAVPRWAPLEDKRATWRLEDAAAAVAAEAALAQIAAQQHLHTALSLAPTLTEAHQALADLHREAFDAAEGRGDTVAAARALALVQTHDRGRLAGWLAGEGSVSLVTSPPARVRLARLELADRRWVPGEAEDLGTTPILELRRPHGRYVAELTAPGHHPLRVPLRIDRDAHADGVRPGDDAPTPVALAPLGTLGPDDVYVPAGAAWLGEPTARSGLPRRRIWVDGFVIRRDPVTNAEFLAWLERLVAEGRADEADRHQPRAPARGGPGAPIYGRDGDRFVLVPDAQGDLWRPDWPVVLVTWEAARAYCADLARDTGLPWRLPWGLEREKATRGVDGRPFPWGEEGEPTWFANALRVQGRPLLAPVGEPPEDVSVYGVRGLAGNCRDWCADVRSAEGPTVVDGRFVRPEVAEPGEHWRVTRGGAWAAGPEFGRAGHRLTAPQGFAHALVGFRPARSLR